MECSTTTAVRLYGGFSPKYTPHREAPHGSDCSSPFLCETCERPSRDTKLSKKLTSSHKRVRKKSCSRRAYVRSTTIAISRASCRLLSSKIQNPPILQFHGVRKDTEGCREGEFFYGFTVSFFHQVFFDEKFTTTNKTYTFPVRYYVPGIICGPTTLVPGTLLLRLFERERERKRAVVQESYHTYPARRTPLLPPYDA